MISRSLWETMLRLGGVGMVIMGLLAGPAAGRFSAGTANCTFSTTPTYCDGVRGRDCTSGANKCSSGTSFVTCTDGTGGDTSCGIVYGCQVPSGGLKYATTNSTGC